jgi:hypothetical protein
MTDGVGSFRGAGAVRRFDELFAASAPLVLSGRHQRDVVPADGGRWGVTAVLRVPDDAATVLAALTEAAAATAGPGHFRTGHPDAVHVTVRAFEAYREAARPDDPFLRRCIDAVGRVAARTPPVRLRVTGVTLAPIAVMAQVEPADGVFAAMTADLAAELGDDASFERPGARSIAHSTLLHLADDVLEPRGLVDWVAAHRSVAPVGFTATRLDVVRSRYVERPGRRCMAPEAWATFPLDGGGF